MNHQERQDLSTYANRLWQAQLKLNISMSTSVVQAFCTIINPTFNLPFNAISSLFPVLVCWIVDCCSCIINILEIQGSYAPKHTYIAIL